MGIYFLLGLSLFSVFSFMFLLVGLNADEWWHKIVYFMIGLISSFTSALLWMVTEATVGPVLMYFFTLMGFIHFIIILFLSIEAYNLKYPSRNKRYRPEVE